MAQKANIPALFLMLFLGFVALFTLGLDRYGLFDVDEAIFTQASLEMIETGEYVAPTYNGEPRYHKPPLIYWVQSAVLNHFGFSPFFARLPSAIFALLSVFVFYNLVAGMTRNNRYALIATAIMGLNLSFLAVSQAATADMALNFFILFGTLLLVSNMYDKHASAGKIWLAGIVLGLGVLTKGPVALLAPGVAVWWVLLTGGSFFYHLRCANPLILGAAILLVIAPWCYFIVAEKGLEFFKEFWLVHNLGRFADGLGNTHTTSYYYYVGVLLFGFFPWVLFIPGALLWVIPKMKLALRSPDPMDTLPMIGLMWALAVLVFFSFSATKLPHYILPAIPGLALFVAARLDDLPRDHVHISSLLMWAPLVLILAFVFAGLKVLPDLLVSTDSSLMISLSESLGFAYPLEDEKTLAILRQDVYMSWAPVVVALLFVIGSAVAFFLMNHGQRKGIYAFALTMWMSLMLVSLGVVPAVWQYMQKPLAVFGESIKDQYEEGDQAIFYSIHQPSVRLMAGVPFVSVEAPEKLAENFSETGSTFIVMKEEKLPRLIDTPANAFAKECKGGYCLLKSQPK